LEDLADQQKGSTRMRSVFESELELLNAEMLVMGSSTEEALMTAVRIMETRNEEEANSIIEGDDDIDRLEREIEGLCMKLLLTQQPVAGDLRRVSASLKMVGDMERIGDQAADIAEIAMTLDGPLDSELSGHLRAMGSHSISMVHDAVQSHVDRDRTKAKMVIEEDSYMNDLFDKVKWDVTSAIQNGNDFAADLVDALMIAKYYERVGDHAKNIAEWVEYSLVGIYKGELIG
jgi:phosphate transport system protein